eukprot:1517206-Pyramimonas_sp.AAC.1
MYEIGHVLQYGYHRHEIGHVTMYGYSMHGMDHVTEYGHSMHKIGHVTHTYLQHVMRTLSSTCQTYVHRLRSHFRQAVAPGGAF